MRPEGSVRSVRVMVAAHETPTGRPLGPERLVEAMRERGRDAVLVAGPAASGWLRRIAAEVHFGRPDVALLFDGPRGPMAASLLAGLRVPFVLFVEAPPQRRVRSASTWATARLARGLVTLDPEVPAALHRALGIRGVAVLGGGPLDLDLLPWGAREEARRLIGLETTQRFVALTGPLGPSVRLDLLALAHRRIAGLGLIVIGTGPQDPLVGAMSASTRPSSPVLHVPTLDVEARRIALVAADLAVALDAEGEGEDALWAAALGRRLVAFPGPTADRVDHLYPGLDAVIRVPSPAAEALRGALEAGLERERALGPLPASAVEAARRSLGRARPVDALVEVLRCACSS